MYAVVKIPFIDYKSTEYGLISGPLFTVVYTICGVLISYFGSAKVRHGRVQSGTKLLSGEGGDSGEVESVEDLLMKTGHNG